MKSNVIFSLLVPMFLFTNCGDNKAANSETQMANNTSKEKKVEPTVIVESSQGDGIVGTWKLQKEVFDDNGNRIPDETELKKAYSNNYHFVFNADGTCKIQQMFTGRYEKKNENGRNMLYVYRKKVAGEEDQDPPPDIFQITSVKPDELILQIIEAGEPSSFWFFKRL